MIGRKTIWTALGAMAALALPGCALNVYGPRNDITRHAGTSEHSGPIAATPAAAAPTAAKNPRETATSGSSSDLPSVQALAAQGGSESSQFDRRLRNRPLADRPLAERHPVARLTGHESVIVEQPPALLTPRVPLFPVPTRPVFGPAGVESHPSSTPPEMFRMAPPLARPPQQPENIVPGVEAKAPSKADAVTADFEPRPIAASERISTARAPQSVLVRSAAHATSVAPGDTEPTEVVAEVSAKVAAEPRPTAPETSLAGAPGCNKHRDSQAVDPEPMRLEASAEWKSRRASAAEVRAAASDRTKNIAGTNDVRTSSTTTSTATTSSAATSSATAPAQSGGLNWR